MVQSVIIDADGWEISSICEITFRRISWMRFYPFWRNTLNWLGYLEELFTRTVFINTVLKLHDRQHMTSIFRYPWVMLYRWNRTNQQYKVQWFIVIICRSEYLRTKNHSRRDTFFSIVESSQGRIMHNIIHAARSNLLQSYSYFIFVSYSSMRI